MCTGPLRRLRMSCTCARLPTSPQVKEVSPDPMGHKPMPQICWVKRQLKVLEEGGGLSSSQAEQ